MPQFEQSPQHPVMALLSLHLDFDAHPGMDAALKEMLAPRKPGELDLAALQDTGPGNLDSRKASSAFWNDALSRGVQSGDEATSELCDFGEGVRFAALIRHT